jgi:hypothetical protein
MLHSFTITTTPGPPRHHGPRRRRRRPREAGALPRPIRLCTIFIQHTRQPIAGERRSSARPRPRGMVSIAVAENDPLYPQHRAHDMRNIKAASPPPASPSPSNAASGWAPGRSIRLGNIARRRARRGLNRRVLITPAPIVPAHVPPTAPVRPHASTPARCTAGGPPPDRRARLPRSRTPQLAIPPPSARHHPRVNGSLRRLRQVELPRELVRSHQTHREDVAVALSDPMAAFRSGRTGTGSSAF